MREGKQKMKNAHNNERYVWPMGCHIQTNQKKREKEEKISCSVENAEKKWIAK